MRRRGHIARDKETAEPLLTAIAAVEQQEVAPSLDANARLRDAVETISEAFVLWDNQNRLVMCNSKYQQFHGLPDAAIRPGTTALKESHQRLADSEQQQRASVTELRLSRRELEQQKQQLVDLAEKYAVEKNRAEAANRAKP